MSPNAGEEGGRCGVSDNEYNRYRCTLEPKQTNSILNLLEQTISTVQLRIRSKLQHKEANYNRRYRSQHQVLRALQH